VVFALYLVDIKQNYVLLKYVAWNFNVNSNEIHTIVCEKKYLGTRKGRKYPAIGPLPLLERGEVLHNNNTTQ
jgi:hypothetical protein